MSHKRCAGYVLALRFSAVSVAITLVAFPVHSSAQNATRTTPVMEEYKIGPGDVLAVTVTDAPEFGGKLRVSDTGTVQIVGVSAPLRAEGLTAAELSSAIRGALVDSKQLRDPKVNVFIDEFHGRTITVLGAVAKPAVYSLNHRTTVLEALSLAGGTVANAGSTVTLVRGPASAEATGQPLGSVTIIDLAKLGRGEDLSQNVEVRNGDLINVSAAEVVYVVGAVVKPGGYVMTNPSAGVSVVQAVALAEGLSPLAAGHKGVIVRQSTSQQGRQDLDHMMAGRETDVLLAPNDILFVPQSGAKKTLKVMGDVAMAAVNGLAIYGLGYRVGNSPH